MRKFIYPACLVITLSACNNSEEKNDLSMLKDTTSATSISVSRTVLDGMMRTLPSPIEIANIISKSDKEFNKELLLPSEYSEKATDKHAQALLLGAYGVDLGYLNLNNKTMHVISYLEAIRNVSHELKVEQYFDFELLSSLAKNRNNVDSLINISTNNFNQIDEFLRTQNRGDLSVLILIGAWIEGLYMFNDIAAKDPNQDIMNRIGEQKVIVDNVFAILKKLEHIPYYKDLTSKMQPLKAQYEKVKLSYVYHAPETKEVNGELIIEDKTETIIEITPKIQSDIRQEVINIRKNVFGIQN